MTPDEAAWVATLDEITREIEAVDAAIDDGAVPPAGAWRPPELGPPPTALRPKIEEVLASLRALEQRAERARDALRTDVVDVDRRRSAAAAYHRNQHTA